MRQENVETRMWGRLFLGGWLFSFGTLPGVGVLVSRKKAPTLASGGVAPYVAFAGRFIRKCVDDISTWGTVVRDRRGEQCWRTGVEVNKRRMLGPETRRVPLRRRVQVYVRAEDELSAL